MSRPRLLVTRPREEAARTFAAAEASGFEAVLAPLQQISPTDWVPPIARPDAILFTSARAPGFSRGVYLDVPVYAVGAHSAAAARVAGYRVDGEGETDGSEALALAVAAGARDILHLGGAERAALSVPPGVRLEQLAVYAAEAVPALAPHVVAMLGDGRLFATLIFSPRAAGIFADLVAAASLTRGDLRLVALSPAVATAAGSGWQAIGVAKRPHLDSVFAAARCLWQGGRHG